MRRKRLDWCMHCGKEIPKQVYSLSWCKSVGHVSKEMSFHVGLFTYEYMELHITLLTPYNSRINDD